MKRLKARLVISSLVLLTAHELLARVASVVVWNKGVSFGLEVPGVAVLAALILIFWSSRKEENMGINLVIAGGVTNLIDRLRWGAVRDYWNFGMLSNNVADWAIGLGVLWLVISFWRNNGKGRRN